MVPLLWTGTHFHFKIELLILQKRCQNTNRRNSLMENKVELRLARRPLQIAK